jgi:hypothetical protein
MIEILSDIKRSQKQLISIDDGIHTGIKHGVDDASKQMIEDNQIGGPSAQTRVYQYAVAT